MGTMLVKRVAAAKASECGAVVSDASTSELLHYTERPETCAPHSTRRTRPQAR
jgi:hypothetical protein